jgi:hypothetical protein
VDVNKKVYVYNTSGVLQGSWTAGSVASSAQIEGIATNGTDIWLVDAKQDKVFMYAGAATRLSGSPNAASSFSLNSSNTGPKDIVTDGTSFWVVDGTALKVFKYTLSGSPLGSWTIDPANTHPTGITINPNNVSDIWIVDNGTLKVYQYTAAAGRTSGSQSAAATFALNPNDTNPQGIADPPPADLLLTAVPGSLAASLPADSFAGAAAPSTVPALATILSSTSPHALSTMVGGERAQWINDTILNVIFGGTSPAHAGDQPSAVERELTSGGGSSNGSFGDQPMPFAPMLIDSAGADSNVADRLGGILIAGESQASSGATDTLFAVFVDHLGSEE